MERKSHITIISGGKGEGKTTLIGQLIKALRRLGIPIKGLISTSIENDGKKIGVAVENLATGEQKQLAFHEPGWDADMPLREWRFDKNVLTWGNKILDEMGRGEVLIVDEIGYLELENNQGWTAVFSVLQRGLFEEAYLIVRESLLPRALSHWKYAKVVHLSDIDDKVSWVSNEAISVAKRLNAQKGEY